VFCIVVALGLLSIERLSTVNDTAEVLGNHGLPSTAQAGKLLTSIYSFRLREARYLLLAADGADLDKAQADLAAGTDRIVAARAAYTPLIIGGSATEQLVRQFDREWTAYGAESQRMIGLAHDHDAKAATALFNGASRDSFDRAIKALNEAADLDVRAGKQAADRGAAIYISTRTTVIAALVFAAVFCALLGWMLVAGVSTPIQRATAAMKRLADHDLSTTIPGVGRRDEIGAMAAAVQIFKDNIIEADRLTAEQRAEHGQREARAARIEAANAAFDRSAGDALGVLGAAAETLRTTEQQGAATQEIARNVQEAARGTAEVAHNVTGLNQIVEATGGAAVDVLGASDALGEQAGILRDRVNRYLSDIRAA